MLSARNKRSDRFSVRLLHCDERVYLFLGQCVCLSGHISQKLRIRTSSISLGVQTRRVDGWTRSGKLTLTLTSY